MPTFLNIKLQANSIPLLTFQVPPSPRKEDDSFDEDMIDLASLETEAQLCMLPFLRISSLVRHYLFQDPLPIIEEMQGKDMNRAEESLRRKY